MIIFQGIEMPVYEIGNFKAVSALAHELKLDNGVTITPNPAFAKLVKASVESVDAWTESFQNIMGFRGMESIYKMDSSTFSILSKFHQDYPDYYIISSLISVQTYGHGTDCNFRVISPITTDETCRLPNDQKVCYHDRWNVM